MAVLRGLSSCSCLPADLSVGTDRCRDSLPSLLWQPFLLTPALFLLYCQRDETVGDSRQLHTCRKWWVSLSSARQGRSDSTSFKQSDYRRIKNYFNDKCGLDVSYDVTYVVKLFTFASVELCDICTRRTSVCIICMQHVFYDSPQFLVSFMTCRGNTHQDSGQWLQWQQQQQGNCVESYKSAGTQSRTLGYFVKKKKNVKNLISWWTCFSSSVKTPRFVVPLWSFLSFVKCCVSVGLYDTGGKLILILYFFLMI